jgi:PHP family Zn ribbon phosphoesterase
LTYKEIINSIESRNDNFLFTIETNPAYGKYHWTGHRNCGISFPAKDAMSRGNVCPICRKKLTRGVEQRVEEMADREIGHKPTNAKDFFHLLPLSEIIAFILGKEQLASPKIWEVYNSLIEKFGNEYFVLLNAKKDDIEMVAGKEIAATIIGIREGRMRVAPGYDGLYGKLEKIDSIDKQKTRKAKKITHLDDYFK